MAGFDWRRSVDTPTGEMAGLAGPTSIDAPTCGFVGGRPRPRTLSPAALRYALAVSRRTDVSSSMRLSDQPSRPSAITCCRFSSLKTLAIPAQEHDPHAFVNVSTATS
jgi:hypothetical protein